MMSSFSASLMPSASVCSRPNGPVRLGPGRCCMRPMTRRSNQMTTSVFSIRKTKIASALMTTSHHVVSLKSAAPGPAVSSAVVMPHLPC